MRNKYKVAIVGLGFFGGLHLKVLSSMSEVEVVGIADLNQDVWKTYKKEFPEIAFYTDATILLNDPNVNVVHITTDEYTHYDLCMRALQAGKNVFIEKPMATSAEHAREIAYVAQSKGLKVGVGHLLRYDHRHVAMYDHIRKGGIGAMHALTLRRNYKRSMLQVYGRINAYITAMVHDIDLVQYFSGQRVYAVHGIQAIPERNSFRFNTATLHTDQGTIALLENLWLLPEEYPYDMEFEVVVYGDSGMARLRIQPDVEFFDKNTIYPELYLGEALHRELEHFVDHVLYEKSFVPSLKDCIHTVEIAEALIAAASESLPYHI